MKKKKEFKEKYGISKKNLNKMFITIAKTSNKMVEYKDGAIDCYNQDSGEMINDYTNQWEDYCVLDNYISMKLFDAYRKGYTRLDELIHSEDRVG